MQQAFDNYFAYTTKEGTTLQFLNYRIIQSDHGTAIDQSNHIRQTMLRVFFPDPPIVPCQSSPFPLEASTEIDLFQAAPMSDKCIQMMTKQYHGSYNHWVGALLHIADKSRWDISYLAMRLSGYNNCPSIVCYNILYQGMCYLFHHPHVPLMYPSKRMINKQTLIPKAKFERG